MKSINRTKKVVNLGTRSIIDGQDVETGSTFEAVSPASGAPIAVVHRAGKPEIDAAVAAARKAFLHWGSLPVRERQRFLQKVLAEVVRLHEPLARLIASEQGKPVAEARAVDLIPVADTLRYLSRRAGDLLAPRPVEYEQILFAHKSASYRFDPLGVIGIVTPWNFPFGIPFVEVAAALAAGNTVVLKPASATALTGIAVGEICRRRSSSPARSRRESTWRAAPRGT